MVDNADASPPRVPITFIDNPHAPEFFADEASGIAFLNENIRLTFESMRVNHVTSPGPVNRVVIGRLVIPLAGAERLRDLLTNYIGKIRGDDDQPTPPQAVPPIIE